MKKNVILILSVLALLLPVISCGGGSGDDSPAKAVTTLFDYVKSKNYDKATNLFFIEDGKELSDSEAQKIKALLMASEEEMQKKGGIEKVEIISEEVDENGTSGKVKFKLIFGNGDDDSQSYNLSKIEGTWKLKAISGF